MPDFTESDPLATEHARRARSFGAAAASYADHRPDYPEAAVTFALAPVARRRPLRVLDLAAGTGKLTEVLLRAGLDVIAVEPDAAMREELIRRLRGVVALPGSAEAIPLPDNRVDAVLVGQALHWFDLDLALPEIARVLTPGGVLAALWNLDDDRVDWVRGFADLAEKGARYSDRSGRGIPDHPEFQPHELREFAHKQPRTAASLTATVGTHSPTLVRTPAEQEALLSRVRAYLETHPVTAYGEFDFPLVTTVSRAVARK
ncbi:class I SAM-dependent methyltransferase [Crossiella sp. CA-258035]|uniref:class I SAM-dependent methyltransferase n=1 Tax=Crossiella sp. CA-258035 TaxID=2981138 RepID=UPI0024BC0946|nr:class I SAM-dependent methyltransferase [Crossiella sp. CA-258035]WHT19844.1 class I SAM-dependent methyltransferase [Crossiella sp. CA-258035]